MPPLPFNNVAVKMSATLLLYQNLFDVLISYNTLTNLKGGPITGVKRQFTDESESIFSFLYKNHTYHPLNLGLDIEADGITYHLSSEFVGDSEMGAVIDTIELERSKRNSA